MFKNPDDPDAGKRFQEMAAAFVVACIIYGPQLTIIVLRYEILSSVETREVYDRYGMDGLSGPGRGGGGPDIDPADIFAEFFGPGMFNFDFGGPGSRGKKRGNETIDYEVTLEDLYNGKSVKMNMEKEIVCNSCNG